MWEHGLRSSLIDMKRSRCTFLADSTLSEMFYKKRLWPHRSGDSTDLQAAKEEMM